MKTFFDTNVLVYLFDNDNQDKKQIAQDLFTEQAKKNRLTISTQVLQELYVVLTRKLRQPMKSATCERVINDLTEFNIVQIDTKLIVSAIQLNRKTGYSFWDSLIIESALHGNSTVLYSEDMQHHHQINGLTIVNPFI